jgi:hypothetical protein
MKTYTLDGDKSMSKTEVRPITVEGLDLQTDETVTSATATHTPPSGSALTITPTVDTPFVNMLFGPFAVAGWHYVMVQVVGSDGSKPEVLYVINVKDAGS